jgi:molecular chaperone DnaJ
LAQVGARTQRDYYALLGVPRDADRESIRRAFRNLAAECHPDVSSEPEALERFREIAEAYEVLSRPETRARYDRYGFGTRGVGGFSSERRGGSFGLFDDLLDFVAAYPRTGKRGADVHVAVELEFLEAARGASRSVRFRATSSCQSCRGEGSSPGTPKVSCTTCGGRGRTREGGEETGEALRLRVCADCGGSGRRTTRPCPDCRGKGYAEEDRNLLVDLPPGVADGAELRLEGEGNIGTGGGVPGDVVVRVRVRPAPDNPFLRRLAGAGALVGLGLLVFVVVH